MAENPKKRADEKQPMSREEIRAVVNQMLITFGLPLLLIAVVTAGLLFFNLDATARATTWWFVVALVVLIHSFLQGQTFNAKFATLHREIKEQQQTSAKEAQDELSNIVRENVDPHVQVLGSLKEIRFAAATMIDEEIKNKDKESEVCYLGSASLAASDQDARRASQSDSEGLSDVARYQNSLDDLKDSTIKVTRFIRLLEDDRFKSRDATTRAEYMVWLQGQVTRLNGSRNYVLYDCRRAPEWGGPRSSILTSKGMLDIVGAGDAGLYLISNRIPKVFLLESKQYFWKARRAENRPKAYAADEAHLLQRRVEELKALDKKLRSREGK
jgi:hypothetical protein